ncbi:hypothetical protein PybrP1_010377 [[Pythium] brassicae (nom. inval.)]|nr:hypothetical protein PybrP1_010377 [[Pythium] brassicae (nom. inval.)]
MVAFALAAAAVIAGQQAFLADISHKFHVLQLIILLGYSVMFLLCVALIAYLRYNRNVAFKGDSTAARKVILPAFEPLLWILCIATGGFATFLTLALACNWFKNTISALATECFYSGRQFVFLMVVLYMLQKSASIPALSRTVAINFVLSTYTIPLQYLLAQTNHADGSASSTYYVGLTLARALLLLLYVYVFIRPPGRASARTIREYCVFAFIYYALLFTYNELFRRARMEEAFLMTSRNDDSVGSVGGGYYSNSPSITLTSGQAKMTVKGTVDYMAPEIIKGRAGQAEYGEAADVYSLAVTMWDILNPGAEKFPTLRNNHLQVFEFVVDGMRPRLEGEATHPGLRQVIESAWHSDPRMRPSAQNIVHILESIQEEMQAVFAQDLMHEFKFDMVAMNNPGDVMPTLFTGEHAVARMEDMNYVNTTAEAVRLGNALMDAGLLHHQKHARGFESSDALYYFDEDNIVLCKPICVGSNPRGLGQVEILGGSDFRHDAAAAASPQHRHVQDNGTPLRPRQCSEHSAFTSLSTADKPRSDQPLLENGMCSCRKLGQRLENPRGARRRYRRKFKAVSEENVLTAKLLAADTSQTTLADFDGFDAVDSNMHA